MEFRRLIPVILTCFFSIYQSCFAAAPVKIAILTDMSGPYAGITANNVHAAQLAIDDFGGMVLGERIEFIFRDHQTKTELANQMASELYEKEKVDAIFDCPNSTAALAVSHKAKLNKKLFFSVTSGTSRHIGRDCNRYTFDWCYSTSMQATAVGLWAAENLGKKWFAITADYEWGHDLLKHFKHALRSKYGRLLGNELAPLGASHFTHHLSKAKKANPDVILFLNAGRDNISAVKDAIKLGIKGQIPFIQPSLNIAGIEAAGKDVYAGDYGAISWYWEIDNPGSEKFVKKWFDVFNKPPNFFNAGTYSAVTQFLEAVKRAGTKSSESVIKQLEGHTFTDIFANPGTIRPEDHMQIGKAYIVRVKKANVMTTPFGYLEIVDQVPANTAHVNLNVKDCRMEKF